MSATVTIKHPGLIIGLAVAAISGVIILAIIGALAYAKLSSVETEIVTMQKQTRQREMQADTVIQYIHNSFDSILSRVDKNQSSINGIEKAIKQNEYSIQELEIKNALK